MWLKHHIAGFYHLASSFRLTYFFFNGLVHIFFTKNQVVDEDDEVCDPE